MDNMNITSAQYVADIISGNNDNIKATIDGQELSVPLPPNTPNTCLLYTSPSPRDGLLSRMPSSA